jgi:hypothetical protein
MTKWMNVLAAGCLVVLGVPGQGAAEAAEITMVGGMGVISGLRDLRPDSRARPATRSMRFLPRT